MRELPIGLACLAEKGAGLQLAIIDADDRHRLGKVAGGEDLVGVLEVAVAQRLLDHSYAGRTQEADDPHSIRSATKARPAERLRQAGGSVSYTCHAGMIHHFYGLASIIPAAGKAVDAICHDIARRSRKPTHLKDEACRLE
jgi:hypothetical protein